MPFAPHNFIYLPATGWDSLWSHDQVISWSVIKWPIHSSVKSNWWSPTVQNKSLGLVHKCMTLNLDWFFRWYYPSPQAHFSSRGVTVQFISVLTTSPSFVPPVYFITTFLLLVPRSGMEILLIILHAILVQIFSWSPGKLDLSEFPREKSIDFLLIRENLFFYQWNV